LYGTLLLPKIFNARATCCSLAKTPSFITVQAHKQNIHHICPTLKFSTRLKIATIPHWKDFCLEFKLRLFRASTWLYGGVPWLGLDALTQIKTKSKHFRVHPSRIHAKYFQTPKCNSPRENKTPIMWYRSFWNSKLKSRGCEKKLSIQVWVTIT
jgi:hypothetical protein